MSYIHTDESKAKQYINLIAEVNQSYTSQSLSSFLEVETFSCFVYSCFLVNRYA